MAFRKEQHVKRLYRRRILLAIEYIAAFIALPTALYSGYIAIPKIPLLITLSALCFSILLGDPRFRKKKLHTLEKNRTKAPGLKTILVRFTLITPALITLSFIISPEETFSFPFRETERWFTILLLYPALSALPQELIYRSFFFHRYRELFPGNDLIVLTSTLTFSFMHIIYGNIIAVTLSLTGGYFFSKTYLNTRSLPLAAFEHAIYGMLIFTAGLGRYFVNL